MAPTLSLVSSHRLTEKKDYDRVKNGAGVGATWDDRKKAWPSPNTFLLNVYNMVYAVRTRFCRDYAKPKFAYST